jgi:hypothetical protein
VFAVATESGGIPEDLARKGPGGGDPLCAAPSRVAAAHHQQLSDGGLRVGARGVAAHAPDGARGAPPWAFFVLPTSMQGTFLGTFPILFPVMASWLCMDRAVHLTS